MSILTFEEHTEDLTEQEHEILPQMREWFKIVLSGGVIQKQPDIVDIMNMKIVHAYGPGYFKMNTVRLRKYINYFRTNGELPIIATSEGCYITKNKEDIQKQITSLEQRARQIQRAALGLKKLL